MGTLYIGVTSNLAQRVWEHKTDLHKGFTWRYQVHSLVWYQFHETIEEAIACEKRMKAWKREWKIQVIEEMNPTWNDLYPNLA